MRRRFPFFAAIVGVLTITAVAGPSIASAEGTVLCKKNEEPCSVANTYALSFENFKGHFNAPPEGGSLVMPFLGTVTCKTGKLASTLEETEGPLQGEVAKWNFFNCAPTGCAIAAPSEIETGFSSEVEAVGEGNGTMTVGNEPTLTATCAGNASFPCKYRATSMEFSVAGGTGAEGDVAQISSEAAMSRVFPGSTFFCPPTATYVSLYQIVEPGFSLFVTH